MNGRFTCLILPSMIVLQYLLQQSFLITWGQSSCMAPLSYQHLPYQIGEQCRMKHNKHERNPALNICYLGVAFAFPFSCYVPLVCEESCRQVLFKFVYYFEFDSVQIMVRLDTFVPEQCYEHSCHRNY